MSLVINLGGPASRQDRLISLSLCCAVRGEWNKVEAGRSGRDGYLRLNGQVAKGRSSMAITTLDVDNVLYIGKIIHNCIILSAEK